MPEPCRCWNDPIGLTVVHGDHCCFFADRTRPDEMGPISPTSCGHFVADSVIGRAQAAHYGKEDG